MDLRIDWLNQLPSEDATREFMKCCSSKRWVQQMVASRPFNSFDELSSVAETNWWKVDRTDWLEAFSGHPKIGEKKSSADVSIKSQQWSKQEQSGMTVSKTDTAAELARLNQEYERKFGYIYIVCATGKSADEMLEILRERIRNDAATELRIAATEQLKITNLRLNKLLSDQRT